MLLGCWTWWSGEGEEGREEGAGGEGLKEAELEVGGGGQGTKDKKKQNREVGWG